MTKLQFILALRDRLKILPERDIEERLSFYSEMIEDRMEEGLAEEEAVAAVGNVDEIAKQILSEFSLVKEQKEEQAPKKRISNLAIVLIILGFPLWLPLIVAAFAVVLSLYITLWAMIVVLWAIFLSAVFGAIAGLFGGIFILLTTPSEFVRAMVMLGVAAVLAGVSILFFYICKSSTKGAAFLTRAPFSRWR